MSASAPPPPLGDVELAALLRRVFRPTPRDRRLAVLTDLPDAALPDTPAWRERRSLAAAWAERWGAMAAELGLATQLFLYRHAAANNAELPERVYRHPGGPLPATADELDPVTSLPFPELLAHHQILIALTQLSATAPLKVAARHHAFRAATMPGFSPAMLPALTLDPEAVDRRVRRIQGWLDAADGATLRCTAAGRRHRLDLDLRHRTAHASSGLLPEPGMVGNLPSGEAYIVPYEGERPDDPSRSAGTLPVELDGEVVVFTVRGNRAVAVEPGGAVARREAERLAAEPACGNLAELGFGVLADLGIRPVGEILLDEKLGLHVAFGRSDHFGGAVGPSDFRSPAAVVHLDRVYLPETQPQVRVEGVELHSGGATRVVWRDGRYAVDLEATDG